MKIDFNVTEATLSVALDGRLDTITAPELESFLREKYDGISAITFDCEKLAYVSSAGLRVLLAANKKMKGSMKLKKSPPLSSKPNPKERSVHASMPTFRNTTFRATIFSKDLHLETNNFATYK